MRLFNRVTPKKLNIAGIGHHALLAILVISTIAGVGAWRVWSSSAATLDSPYQRYVANQPGCELSGRVWNSTNSDCLAKCRAGTGVYRTIKGSDGATRGFCTESVAESMNTVAEAKRCIETLKRFYIREIGCARRASQENTNNAKQCIGYNTSQPYKNYVAEGGVDRCIAPVIAQTGDNTGAATAATTTDPIATVICQALGRKTKDASNCYRDCRADTGTLLVFTDAAKTKYCSRSVATTIAQARCAELHRRWTPAGCAARPDQTGPDGNYTIACLSGFPWYNVNSTASAGGTGDVCEKDAATAAANEKAGVLGTAASGTPVCKTGTVLSADKKSCVASSSNTTGSGSTSSGSGAVAADNEEESDADVAIPTTDTSGYKVVLYTDKNFKGDSVTITEATPDLGKKWGNKISSYRVVGGRWQICPETEFKANKKLDCVFPWASNPNLNDGKDKTKWLDNQISSVRPYVPTISQVAEIKPSCMKDGKAVLDATGKPYELDKCPGDAPINCPTPLVYDKAKGCIEKVPSPQVIVPVDTSFKGKAGQERCELLGREYIAKPAGNKVNNGGQYGCSLKTCERDRDGAPVQAENGPVCVNYEFGAAYAVSMTRKKCSDLHREYIPQVKRCAQVPNRKDKDQKVVNAKQCRDSGHTVYYIFKASAKDDECFNPNYFQRARSVAKSTGGSLSKALKQGPRSYCATVKRGNYHWNGKKCVIDRKTCWNGQNIAVTKQCPAQPITEGRGASGGSADSGSTGGGGQSASEKCRAAGNLWISDGRGEQYGYCRKTVSCTSNGFCYDSDNPLGLDPSKPFFPTVTLPN